ncbi:unnamed protein product [Lymnaea stagnalis]|uniref:Uncharacterized protein n=1 Tax=Lymnaea stagnalis TaxID=6523 RepID=A0AAV2IJX7_LYMST
MTTSSMPTKESPSYSSARVQRASRINGIETARLQKTLGCFEQAMVHQCRLTNQQIRLLSVSMDYIQASSGHSPMAWCPERKPANTSEKADQPPFFLYGERIWTRKQRRLYKPFSAFYGSEPPADTDSSLARSPSALETESSSNANSATQTSGNISEEDPGGSHTPGDFAREFFTAPYPPRQRVTPHQDWEDDTSEVTKKIFKNQARASSGGHSSVYQSAGDVMIAQAARNVRGLVRQIRISGGAPAAQQDSESFLDRPRTRGGPGKGSPRGPDRPPRRRASVPGTPHRRPVSGPSRANTSASSPGRQPSAESLRRNDAEMGFKRYA